MSRATYGGAEKTAKRSTPTAAATACKGTGVVLVMADEADMFLPREGLKFVPVNTIDHALPGEGLKVVPYALYDVTMAFESSPDQGLIDASVQLGSPVASSVCWWPRTGWSVHARRKARR